MKTAISTFALILASYFSFANVMSPVSDELAGAWDYAVETPDGIYKGQLIFTRTGNGYTGKMVSQGNETELKELKIQGREVSFSLYTQGYLAKVKGTVDGDQLNGKVEVEYEFFPLKAQRTMPDSLAGTWNYTATTPEGIYKGRFVFTKTAEGYAGKMIMQENETKLNNVMLEKDKLSFSLSAQGYDIKVKGTINGKIFDGKGEAEYEYFPVKAEKAE